MKRLVLIGLGAAAAATALPAAAQEGPDNRLYIAPTVQYISADSDRAVDDGIGFTMSIGKPITSALNFELIGMMSELDSKVDGNAAEDGIQHEQLSDRAAAAGPSQLLDG